MKLRLIFLILLVVFGLGLTAGSKKETYLRMEFMEVSVAEKKWGVKPFDSILFKKGDEQVRASMATNLIKSQKYVGKPISVVVKDLGPPDGYFVSESVPAYMIESRKPKEPKDSWQIVFLPDESGVQVEEVKIHKNCCYKDIFSTSK